MSDATVRGVVHLIEETKTYGQKGFRKRLVVLEQNKGPRFTNYVPIDFIQEACDEVDELKVGDDVEISYRLSGRKWQRDANSEVKFFLNAEASSFTVKGGGPAAADESGSGTASSDGFDSSKLEPEVDFDDDEVPF